MPELNLLVKNIELLNPLYVSGYIKLKVFSVDDFSIRGFQVSYSKDENKTEIPEFDAIWLPKWSLKKDENSNVYLNKNIFNWNAARKAFLKKNNLTWRDINW